MRVFFSRTPLVFLPLVLLFADSGVMPLHSRASLRDSEVVWAAAP